MASLSLTEPQRLSLECPALSISNPPALSRWTSCIPPGPQPNGLHFLPTKSCKPTDLILQRKPKFTSSSCHYEEGLPSLCWFILLPSTTSHGPGWQVVPSLPGLWGYVISSLQCRMLYVWLSCVLSLLHQSFLYWRGEQKSVRTDW